MTKLADGFFDKDGKPIHRPTSSPVNNVEQCPDLIDTEDENDGVNAVSRVKSRNTKLRPKPHPTKNPNSKTPWGQSNPQRNQSQGNQQRPQGSSQGNTPSFTPAFGDRRENKGQPTVKSVKLCKYHQQFGDSARTCEATCVMFPKWSGNGRAGRQT